MPQSNREVFLNCPFDSEYRNTFQAIIFTAICCGFHPRSALERINSAETARNPIVPQICPASTCPLSWESPSPADRLSGRRKNLLILDSEPHRFRYFLSDIGGLDVEAHGANPDNAIGRVRHWLRSAASEELPGPTYIATWIPGFAKTCPPFASISIRRPKPWDSKISAEWSTTGSL